MRLDTTPTDLNKPQSGKSYSYDKQGNLLSDGSNTYSYDGFNRVAEVRTAEGGIQKNHYDAEGLRHEMEENGQLVKFLYNENREVEVEEEASGNIIRYVRGLGLISSDSESARTYYHYVSDEQGSVTHVLEGASKDGSEPKQGAASNILNRYTYDAFGNTIECEEQVHNRFRYNGEQYDPVTSQYYLRARFYNPAIARFTQEDTYYGDGLNLYQYCANNPVVYKDPSGHNICPGQLDLYKKYKEQGMSPKEAYDQMRKDLGLSKDNPFTADSEGGTKAWYQRDDLKDLSLYDAFEKVKAEKGLTIDNPYANPYNTVGRMDLAGKEHPVSGVKFDSNGFPIFESKYNTKLKPQDYMKSRGTHFERASKALYNAIMKDSNLRSKFTEKEIAIFKEGGVPNSYTWHHHQGEGIMQLVDRKTHRQTGHTGGFSIWGPGN